ncbi:MAG TPA: PPOX class F420-dependent oxidoreductase [Ktedonobacteraceae bacterium]|nr:PPOX class F420-dependent oxidoreductase [Ktedonobacteraceae bacterium]
MTTLSEKARTFLNEKRFAVLATLNADGSVQQTTMWYLLEGDTIVMNTKVGRVKERNLRRDPRISICVEDGYRYLTVSGTAEFIDDQATTQQDIYRLALRYHGEEGAARQMAEQFSQEQRLTVRLTPERVIEDL